jgi:DNA-binding response OmpR family regulator
MKILFVDDESTIRWTLPLILEREGFDVKTAATVGEAVDLINKEQFDILISDLNIGQPGDGFTVVSVMRRMQPNAVTFLLTGYPDFESALQAIRNQVDDYLIKPAEISSLVAALKHKLQNRQPMHHIPARRAPELVLENLEDLLQCWLASTLADQRLKAMTVTPKERIACFPDILKGICAQVVTGKPAELDDSTANLAIEHGISRFAHGYPADLIVAESRLLQRHISDFLQQNLITLDLSTLIPDVMHMTDLLTMASEESIRSFNHKLQVA